MKRIKNWFQHNFQWKLIALVSAFFIWLIVVNSSNPKVTGTLVIPFDVLNEKALVTSSQIYTLSTNEVSITYTVRQKFKNNISADAFSAYINLEDYSVTGAVPVYLEIDSSVSELITDVKINPSLIHVYTESIQQKKFAVKPYLEGEVAEGYVAGEPTVNPEYIYVKGPVSVMGQISGVGIYIDIDGKNENLKGTCTVVFLDANGNRLSGIEDSLSFAGDISYSLPIYRIKSLSVNAFTGGAPASGYTVDSVETSPTFISVYGPEDILNQYSYIIIPGNALNINGISENKTFNVDTTPYIPKGLKLIGQTPEITVYVKVKNIYDNSKAEETTKEQTTDSQSQPETIIESSATETEVLTTEIEESTHYESHHSTEETESPVPEAEDENNVEETLPHNSN